jgi:hypothetical protein
MPDVSDAQRRAMFAAKEGHSTLGIPKSVGEDFIAADQAAGMPSLPKRASKPKKSSDKLGDQIAKSST